MGTGASKAPEVGVPLNPRVHYADGLSKKEGKPMLIDAPVLVQLEHGTVRYRFKEGESDAQGSRQNCVDKPHEGTEDKTNKKGYFFHPTLNDFSEEAAYSKEDEWKFLYVSKGPTRTRQKKLFYVFARGMENSDNKDKGIVTEAGEAKPQGKGYQWPSIFKQHGHVYFDFVFLKQEGELDELDDEDEDIGEMDPGAVLHPVEMRFSKDDRVKKIQMRMSVRLVKPAGHIHIYLSGKELSPTDVIGDLRSEDDGNWKRFRILLKPK